MKTLNTLILILMSFIVSVPLTAKSFTSRDIYRRDIKQISKMIKLVEPMLKREKRDALAVSLYHASRKFAVDPKIMIAIISTESNFNNDAVSTSGDLSLAQINTKVWNNEFKRLGLKKMNINLLKKDEKYALNRMGKILSILKARHSKKDNRWYAIYHSKTKKFKSMYDKKVQTRLRMMASVSL